LRKNHEKILTRWQRRKGIELEPEEISLVTKIIFLTEKVQPKVGEVDICCLSALHPPPDIQLNFQVM
jgi:hypothetical protein